MRQTKNNQIKDDLSDLLLDLTGK